MVDAKPPTAKAAEKSETEPEYKSEDVWYVVGFAGGNVTTYGEYDNKRDAEESASGVVGALVLPSTRKVVEE